MDIIRTSIGISKTIKNVARFREILTVLARHGFSELIVKSGLDKLIPGLTGWAQINGRDSVSIEEKVQLDVYYLENMGWRLDLKIILLTIYYAIRQVGISH
jgi:O-antigen biosynthesis protein WbqP